MKKRILSLVLVLAMCVSILSFGAAAVQAATLGELMEIYKERLWDWQENQFAAITDENGRQEVIDNAWANYEANEAAIRDEAVALVDSILDETANPELSKFYGADTMKDLYKWKLMRDIMEANNEGEPIITNEDAAYIDWLERFTDFEEANDEAISASAPMAALGGLGDYADDLTAYFGELATLVDEGLVLEGEGATKATAYIAAYLNGDSLADIHDDLVADVKELIVDGIVNNFEIGMKLVTNQINRGNTTGVFDMISDRDMKAAFLLVGEELVRDVLDLIPGLRGDLLALPKEEIVAAVIGDAGPILGGDNEAAVNALYDTMANLINFMLDGKLEKIEVVEDKIEDKLGIVVANEYGKCIERLQNVMGHIHPKHGLELVHLNTYLGRTLLRYNEGGEYNLPHEERGPVLEGAEINGNEVAELGLGFAHNRYPVFSSVNNFDVKVTSFDANYDADGIKVYAGDDYGQLIIEVTDEADGEVEALVNVYRGYKDSDQDGIQDGDDEDEYRYVTTFTVTAESDVVADTIELYDIADVKLSEEKIVVQGTTTLDNVVVSITLNGDEKYVLVHTKAEFEAGIEIAIPEGAVVGDVFTVAVGENGTEATDTFTILAEDAVDTIELYDIADVKLSEEKIVVQGTTTLDNVVVSITLNGDEKYVLVHTKAEFEAGIEIAIPEGAVVGDVFTVVVGENGTEATDTFTILAEDATVDTITLDDIADTTTDGTIVVQGTTTLDNVVVSITLNGDEKYVLVHTKAEFEAGIEIAVPDGAAVGDVFTVTVGENGTEATDTFTIVENTIELYDIADVKLSEEKIVVKGTTTLDNVVVSITLNGDEKYVLVHTKAEFEAGIEIAIPEGAVVGDVFTVAVGENGTEATDTFTILAEDVKPTLALAGKDTRNVKKNKTIDITTTPQNVPAGSTAEVRWTTEDGEVIEVTELSGDYNNIATVKGLKKGTTTLTATLYVDGVATDATVTVTVKVTTSNPGPVDRDDTTTPVVKPHECEWPDIAATGTKPAHWAHETIDIMTINGYIKGYEDGTFKPDNNITRAEFSAIVYRILGLEVAEDGVIYDDTNGHWAEDIIATMSLPEGYGMLRGYGDGNFGPNDLITREQAVAIIARAKSATWVEAKEGAKDIFADSEDISWWFDGEMDAAVTNGLITGYEDGSYKPLNFTTRAEACVLLARAWPEVLE